MKHFAAETASVPEQGVPSQESPSRWLLVQRWLGLVSSTSQREASEPVSDGNGAGTAADTHAEHEPSRIDRIMQESEERHAWDIRWEAGSTHGRYFPELVIGPQRYPPPSMWGKGVDEKWLETARMLDERDQRLGFDGTRQPNP
jgi:hypothetical protein